MADQRRGEQLCEHLLSRQVRRSGGAGKPAFAGSDLREDGDVWPSRRPPSRSSCMLPGSKGRAQSKVFERLQTSATLRGSKKTTRRTWSCVLRQLGGRHGRGPPHGRLDVCGGRLRIRGFLSVGSGSSFSQWSVLRLVNINLDPEPHYSK